MNKKLVSLLLIVAVLIGSPLTASAVEPIVLFGAMGKETEVGVEAMFFPWGCGDSSEGKTFATCYSVGGQSGFSVAYVLTDTSVLEVGKSARFEMVVEGGVAPFVYDYEVYYQPFSKKARSYYCKIDEVSTNSYLDFTPRDEGRYILLCTVSDSAGNSVKLDTDAIPTDKGGEISEVVERVAAEALAAGSEYGAVEYIHSWLMDNAEYSGTQSGQYEADSILLCGRGVCSGYASAFNMLCAACGIESFSVHGYASAQPINGKEHSWNCVKVEGDWYFVDVTHDDNSTRTDGFFLQTSATFEQAYCFGERAAAFSEYGGSGLPPRCNATMYAESYDEDSVATDIRIRCGDEYPTSIEMSVGGSCRLIGATTPSCSRHASKIWSASNAKVASIDNCGILTANAVGRCIITITCGELSASVEIIVK